MLLALGASVLPASAGPGEDTGGSFDAARALFYNGQYAEAAAMSRTLVTRR